MLLSSAVEVEREAAEAQVVGEQVEGLSVLADAVGSSEPERVVEVTVDDFAVVAAPVETVEVGVLGWDRTNVLGAIVDDTGHWGAPYRASVRIWSGWSGVGDQAVPVLVESDRA